MEPARFCWCPEINDGGGLCRVVAEILYDRWVESTSGPVQIFRVFCVVHRHMDAYATQVVEME